MARERALICGTPFQPFLFQPNCSPSRPSLSLFTATFFHTFPWLGHYQVSSQVYEAWVGGEGVCGGGRCVFVWGVWMTSTRL